jgi:glucose/arabinose dehydrogenase
MLLAVSAVAAETGNVLKGKDAFGNWKDDAPGVRRLIKVSDLPPALLTPSAANSPDTVKMPRGAKPKVAKGFTVELVASGLRSPRVLRVAPNGDIFVADSKVNEVRVLRLGEGGARPLRNGVFASNLHQPYGIAFYPPGPDPRWIYIANSDNVVRFPYRNGDLVARGKPTRVIDHIPATHHWTRDIAFSPDGRTLYLSVGSGSNVALDMFKEPLGGLKKWARSHALGATWDTEERRADVLAFTPEGKNERIFATGLRNCSGMTVQPDSGALWCVVNERDELGDDTPFEYATVVREGAFYGWPWYFIGSNEDPRRKGERPDLATKVTLPDVLFQAHSAPLNIAFYDGDAFPPDYRGDAFVTLHGSWNRGTRTGYKVVRMIFDKAAPTGEYEDFMTGFVVSDKEVWGRPVGVAVAKDGSLLVSEDGSGTIWRVTYGKNPDF